MEVDYISILAKQYKKEFEKNGSILLEGDYGKNHKEWCYYCIDSLPRTYREFSKSWLSMWSNIDEMNLTFGAMLRSQYLNKYIAWLVYQKRFLKLKEVEAIAHNIMICKIKKDYDEAFEYVISNLGKSL